MADHLEDIATALLFALRKLKEANRKPSQLIINEYNKLLDSAHATRPHMTGDSWPAKVETQAAAALGAAESSAVTYAELEAKATQLLTILRRK